MSSQFEQDIIRFNKMYRMPQVEWTYESIRKRALDFESILKEEVSEFDDALQAEHPMDMLVALCDLYGDIIVYCASELRRHGISPDAILGIIMQSNFSKLDENGQPIYDERGKVLKGPNYWKPEPKIAQYLNHMKYVREQQEQPPEVKE